MLDGCHQFFFPPHEYVNIHSCPVEFLTNFTMVSKWIQNGFKPVRTGPNQNGEINFTTLRNSLQENYKKTPNFPNSSESFRLSTEKQLKWLPFLD